MPESRQDFQNRWQENLEALGKQAISGDMEGAYQQALKLVEADDRGEEPRLIGSEIRRMASMYETTLHHCEPDVGVFITREGKTIPASFLEHGRLVYTDDGMYALQFWHDGFVRELYHLSPDATVWLFNHGYFYEQEFSLRKDIARSLQSYKEQAIRKPQPEYEHMLIPYPEMEV
jgi:hypothetical protein